LILKQTCCIYIVRRYIIPKPFFKLKLKNSLESELLILKAFPNRHDYSVFFHIHVYLHAFFGSLSFCPHRNDAAITRFVCSDRANVWCLVVAARCRELKPNGSNFVSSAQRILLLMVLELFRHLFANPQQAHMCPLKGNVFCLA